MANHKLPVIIIGSGCTGLALANGFKKAGIPTIVFEKNSALSLSYERDWNMGLHWALPTLLGLLPASSISELQSTQVDPHTPTKPIDTLSFLNGLTGSVLMAQQVPNFHRLRRSKLRALLSKDIDIRYIKRLKDIATSSPYSTTAIFEDGDEIEGRLIIGADGPNSAVRKILLGAKLAAAIRLPYAATFVQAKYTREQALFLRSFHPLFLGSPHPDGLFAFFGLQDASEDEPETWTFFFYISWNSSIEQQNVENQTFTNKQRLEQVKKLSERYTEPWKSAFAWLEENQEVWYFELKVWDPSAKRNGWDNRGGRVTLAGDAAHVMTYQRGQGLNHSISDAGKLVDCVAKNANQEEAIEEYEKEMKARAGEEVKLSAQNTEMLHHWEKVLESPLAKKGLNPEAPS